MRGGSTQPEFQIMTEITMRGMLEAGVHFGHQTRFRHPKMAPYIFGERSKIHIINLEKTLPLFRAAVEYLEQLAARDGIVLFVGTKRAARDAIARGAQIAGMPYVNHRWLGGTLTNFETLRQSVRKLRDLEGRLDADVERLPKSEMAKLMRQREKLRRTLGGLVTMDRLPDALFVVDVGRESIAVHEANRLRIPVVGVVDTNNSPDGVDYMFPGNDDAMSAIELYVQAAAEAVASGRARRSPESESTEEFVEMPPEVRPREPRSAVRRRGGGRASGGRRAAPPLPESSAEGKPAAEAAKADDDNLGEEPAPPRARERSRAPRDEQRRKSE
jgi:small subunit ribosomal protein S2